MPSEKIIVIGAGPVGVRFAHEISKREGKTYSITLFGDEPYAPYDRIKLSQLLSQSIDYDSIFSVLPDEKSKASISSNSSDVTTGFKNFEYLSKAIVNIDTDSKRVFEVNGDAHRYDKLVLAVGSKPHVPNLPGVGLKGVYTFRNMRDTEALRARASRCRHVVVVGGGLLGLEVANGLKSQSTAVTLVHQSGRLMNRQLSEGPALELLDRIRQKRIHVQVEDGLAGVQGNVRVEGITTRKGEQINCDTVVLCTGIKPNTELALKAGIKIARGIVVDDSLMTSARDVYAIGECSEHNNQIYGLVAPGLEQAAILAQRFVGGTATYSGSQPYAQLKVVDESVNSMGTISDLAPRPKQAVLNYRNRNTGDCRAIAVHKGRIIGACSVGNWDEAQRVREAVLTHRYFFPWQRLLFLFVGKLWFTPQPRNIIAWPANAIVCQCNQINKGTIQQVTRSGGYSVSAIGLRCGAGTVCGSCQPLLLELIQAEAEVDNIDLNRPPAAKGSNRMYGLLVFSVATLIAALVLWLSPAIKAPDSVRVPSLSFLWTDSFYKQVSGFSLLGITLIGLMISARKRLGWRFLGSFQRWRLVHTMLGLLALAVLLAHTGASLGENLNRFLILNFLLAACLGAGLGLVIAINGTSAAMARIRKMGFWLHVITLWPLPILLSVHIISSYYF